MPLGLFTKPKNAADSQSILSQGPYTPAEKTRLAGDELQQALQLGRFGYILTHAQRWADHPHLEKALDKAASAIDDNFALVPEGIVSIPQTIFDQPGQPERDFLTEPFLLALRVVTNAEYQRFVDAGGYDQLDLWPEDIWPHLIGFKDTTGKTGPRFWQGGCHDRRVANHPVVGISYYEAAAYVAWAGYRLPDETEWQMAASWRLRSAAQAERRYPWGDGLDLANCNIWASGNRGTLAADALPGSAAPNGITQLIGNVWEWTRSDFQCTDREGRRVVGDTLLKGIRGGAYDTYFPWQATSSFRTALACLARTHNVGFRCAMDLPSEAEPPSEAG